MTFSELRGAIYRHNEETNIHSQYADKNPLIGVIVFSNETPGWKGKNYSEESRSYSFRSDEKYFLPDMGGSSLYADCLDGSETGVRLDWYMRGKNAWLIENCYFKEGE